MLDDDETIDCSAWLNPETPLRDLPRMRLDKVALVAAAYDVARETPDVIRDVLVSKKTDARLLPHLRAAMALRDRKAS